MPLWDLLETKLESQTFNMINSHLEVKIVSRLEKFGHDMQRGSIIKL